MAIDAMTDGGLVPVARRTTEGDIVLTFPTSDTDRDRPMIVRRLAGAPTPKVVERLAQQHRLTHPAHGLLLVCDRLTAGAAAAANRSGISVAAADPRVRHGAQVAVALHDRPLVTVPPADLAHHGPRTTRTPWALFHVLRCRALFGELTQREIAGLVGLTQARVSQAVKALRLSDVDHETLVRRWLDESPGPGGVTTYWYGVTPLAEQSVATVKALQDAGAREMAVSGDAAADLVAPWASPRRAVVHTTDGADLSAAGLVPAPSDEATLELVVPSDPALFPVARRFWDVTSARPWAPVPLADPLQIVHDVRRSPSPDRDQAEHVLRTWLRTVVGAEAQR